MTQKTQTPANPASTIRPKLEWVVAYWWNKSGKAWATEHNLDYKVCQDRNYPIDQGSQPYEAFSHLIQDPAHPKRSYLTDVDNPRVRRLIEAAYDNPDAVLKLLEIQYEEAHRKDNQ